MTAVERFKLKVIIDPITECWHWQSGKNKHGFGLCWFRSKLVTAARVAYQLFIGSIPPDNNVITTCQNNKCVNPIHLTTIPRTNNRHTQFQRFMRKVKVLENGCHEWQAATDSSGYGSFKKDIGSTVKAHRWAYEYHTGIEIPENIMACHKCDNRRCVNPEHIFLGTHQENMADMMQKGRSTKGRLRLNRKLSLLSILVIKEALEMGFSHRSIARYFKVSQTSIARVAHGKTGLLVTQPLYEELRLTKKLGN